MIEPNNLFVLGGSRCGSTLFNTILNQNKKFNCSNPNETLYFFKNKISKEFYEKTFFKNKKGIKVETSPQYLSKPTTVSKNIFDIYSYKECKFIIVIRDPIERMISDYNYRLNLGRFDKLLVKDNQKINFKNVIENEFEIYKKNLNKFDSRKYGVFFDSLYYEHIKKWIEIVGKENILFLNMEMLKKDFKGYFNKVNKFCGLDLFEYENFYVNTSSNVSLIQKLIFRKSIIKSILKVFMPKKFRRNLKEKIRLTSTSKKINKNDFSYFYQDIPKEISEILLNDYKKTLDLINS